MGFIIPETKPMPNGGANEIGSCIYFPFMWVNI